MMGHRFIVPWRTCQARLFKRRARSSESGRATGGFSLVELLATLAILVLVGSVAATGVPVAMRAYMTAVDMSNAQLLMSTSVERLRDELSVADPSTVVESAPSADADRLYVTFTSLETGFRTQLKRNSDLGIYVQETVVGIDSGSSDPVDTPLVPSKAAAGATGSFNVELGRIDFDDASGVFTVRDIKVTRDDGSELAGASIDEFNVRTIADPVGAA